MMDKAYVPRHQRGDWENYGQVESHVRQVFNGTMGWFGNDVYDLALTRQELAAFVLGTRAASATDALSQLDRVLDRSHLMPPGAVESVMRGMKASNDLEH